MLFSLFLIWSISHDYCLTGETHHAKKQSWNNQNISSVPSGLDKELRRLDLSNNRITQLPALTLPFLEQLDLRDNLLDLISDLAFRDLAQLKYLDLSGNRLSVNLGRNAKTLRSLGGLHSLDISANCLGNNAAALFLRNKSALDRLEMSRNGLTKLSYLLFRESRNLRSISLEDNLISEIAQGTFEPLSRLETLNLAKNSLVNICDFKLHQVKYLNLSKNSIEFFLTQEDDEAYSLEVFDLSHNKLLYFPVIPRVNQIKYLHLQNNLLGTLNSEAAMLSVTNSFYSEALKEKFVQKNYLHANWRSMPLIYIDLSFNHFTSFPLETLSILSSLEALNFSYNYIHSIDWNIRNYTDPRQIRQIFFPSLKHLNLQCNGLKHISPLFFRAVAQIEMLNLQDNSVKPCGSNLEQHVARDNCNEFHQLKTLKVLNLQGNGIKLLPPNSFQNTSLVSLDLARNIHMAMHEKALEGVQPLLQTLIISQINASRLSLPCLPVLRTLNVSRNQLDRIPSSLACSSSLRVIDLRNNALLTLNRSLVQALSVHLATMLISGNRFNCCDNGWLQAFNGTQSKLADIGEAKCFTRENNLTLTGYLKNPLLYCSLQEVSEGRQVIQLIVMFLFVAVLLSLVVMVSRRLNSTQGSFTV